MANRWHCAGLWCALSCSAAEGSDLDSDAANGKDEEEEQVRPQAAAPSQPSEVLVVRHCV